MEVMWLILIIMSGFLSSEASLTVRHEYIDKSGARISSPNFPKDYNNNEISTYHVVAPTGSMVMLYFNHLDIKGNLYREDCQDVLKVKYWDASTTFIRNLCGFNLPSPIYSLGNEMNLTFQTDSVTTASGFHASVYFMKSTNPYFPMDGVYVSLHILMAVNVTVAIIVSFVVSCFMLYKRNLLQIKSCVRTQEEEYLSIMDGESTSVNPGTAPTNTKDGLHNTSKKAPPLPRTPQRGYLEMKPWFKKKKITTKNEKHMKAPVDTPEGEYASPLTEEIQIVAHKRNMAPSDVNVIDTVVYETNIAIPKLEYNNTVIERDENNATQGILPSTDVKSGIKETSKPAQHSVGPVTSTYGDTK